MQKNRRSTPTVKIGSIKMGSRHPIVVQSMTNTPTSDIMQTTAQIIELAQAGSELVRVTINDDAAAAAIPEIIQQLKNQGCTVPIIGDFHYNGHQLLTKYPKTAAYLAKYRINPGNVGTSSSKNDHFATIIAIAKDNQKPIRIGVNWGSIDQQLFTEMMEKNAKLSTPKPDREIIHDVMVKSALRSAASALSLGLTAEQIVVSVKMSDVQDLIAVNEKLAQQCDYVLHVGLTEAGGSIKGIAASSAALGVLLQQGIGDTIRISLTPEPNKPRSQEVDACYALLQSMGFRYFKPTVTSCPGCGRTNSQSFITLAADIREYIDQRLPDWKKLKPDVATMTIAIMGCVVNGPGESQHATIGISLPGAQENPIAPVYTNGQLTHKLSGPNIASQFKHILEEYITG